VGKQVALAFFCVALALTVWLLPLLGWFVAGFVVTLTTEFADVPSRIPVDLMMMPFLLSILASGVAFVSLAYLKLLYGMMALLGASALWLTIFFLTILPIFGALVGGLATLLTAALISYLTWRVLLWAYAPAKLVNPEEEFS